MNYTLCIIRKVAVTAFDVDVLEFSVHEIRVACFKLILIQIYLFFRFLHHTADTKSRYTEIAEYEFL